MGKVVITSSLIALIIKLFIGIFTRSAPGSSIFQEIMSPSGKNFNLFKNFPLLPPKPISSSSIDLITKTTTTTTNPVTSSVSSILVPQISSADLPKSIPAVTNLIGSLTQTTAPFTVAAISTATLQLPASELRRDDCIMPIIVGIWSNLGIKMSFFSFHPVTIQCSKQHSTF